MSGRQFADLVDHDSAVFTGVGGDPEQRGRQGVREDVHAQRHVTGDRLAQRLQRRTHLDQSATAAGHDALLDRGLGRRHRILDAMLALLERGLGGRADLDHRNATGQLGQPLLQLLAIPVGVGRLDLGLELLDAVGDRLVGAATVNDHRVVLADHHAPGRTQDVEADLAQQQADIGVDHLRTGHDCQVLQERLATVAEERRLDCNGLQRLADGVDDQGGQHLPFDVLGHDQQRFAGLGDLLQQWQQVGQRADLVAVQQHQCVLEDGFLRVEVGHEVGGDEALVEADALGDLQLGADRRGLLHADHAVGSDGGHGLADHLTDFLVARGHGGDLCDPGLAGHRDGRGQQCLGGGVGGLADSHPQRDRVDAGRHQAQSAVNHRLREHGGGGGAVTGDVIGLGRHRLHQLRAEVLERILKVDLTGDGHAVIGDGRSAKCLGQHHMPTARPQCHLDGVGQLVDAGLHGASGGLVELDQLAHTVLFLSRTVLKCVPPRKYPRLSAGISGAAHSYYLLTTASTSRADRIKYSSPLYLISVPPYLL